jgi:hypothetical protein
MSRLSHFARLLRRPVLVTMLVVLGSALLPTRSTAEEGPPSLLEVAAGYGFSASDVETMLSGKIVFGTLESVSDSELALSAGTLSRRSVDWHLETFDTPESDTSDPTQLGIGVLEGDGRSGLAKLTLDDGTLDSLGKVEAGNDMNFSTAEIAVLHAAGRESDPAARRTAVLEAYRRVLVGRYESYRARGLAGLAPYDRGKGKQTSPGAQLERAFGELRLTRQLAPTVHGAMARYPAELPEGVQSHFAWMANGAEGRTLVSLVHSIWGVENESVVTIVRRFYVDQTLNSMQTVSVALPVEEGTAILYANRSSTDLVTGFGSSIAKKVGRMLMRREIGRLVEAFLEVTEPGD